MTAIAILDPSIIGDDCRPSPNLGDGIIAQAVEREVLSLFPQAHVHRVSTHTSISPGNLERIQRSDWVFVGGSNLLGNGKFIWNRLRWWRQWQLNLRQANRIGRAILLGVGWRQYEQRVGYYTAALYRRVLSPNAVHSVRDAYTQGQLAHIGRRKVVNTCCPTVWPLIGKPEQDFSKDKADHVLAMLTDYMPDHASDSALLDLLLRKYRHVYFWPQGSGDAAYVARLGVKLHVLEPSWACLSQFLRETACDYVGTRLHGGIQCLLAGRRSLILRIDNRATEMGRHIRIPMAARDDMQAISEWVDGPTVTSLGGDPEPVRIWRSQFLQPKTEEQS